MHMGSRTGSRPIVATRFARSTPDGRLEPYLGQAATDPAAADMSVIVQEMVAARACGVTFSRNPLTGLADAVIEAVRGTGLELVGRTRVSGARSTRRPSRYARRDR